MSTTSGETSTPRWGRSAPDSFQRRGLGGGGGLGRGAHVRALGDLALVGGERREDLALLVLGHVELVERPGQVGGDRVELLGLDVEPAVGLLEAEMGPARMGRV